MPPYRLEDFSGGLNLATGPIDPKYAIDALDVVYGRAIKTRPGFSYLTSAATLYTQVEPFVTTAGTKRLLSARSGNTDALDTSGAVEDTVAKTFTDAVMFGTPGSETAYLANGSDGVFKYDGSAFSAPANQPEARYLAVQSPDNRLVATGFTAGSNGPSGSTVNESHVHFSDERAPETWTAGSNVQLTPGDGEKIQGCCSWRNMVIVWKQSKFFCFGGNSIDEDGLPVFNREQRSGAGLCAPQAYATSPDGVYFLDKTGIYLTNGGNATRVSQAIDPIFGSATPNFFSSGVVNQSTISGASMTYWNERLYVALPMGSSSTNNRILVFDPKYGWWSIYAIPAASLCTWQVSSAVELMFAHTGNKIGRHSESEDDDSGTAIAGYSRHAWIDRGQQESLREVTVWGSGRITVLASVDYAPSQGTGQTVDLSPTTDVWEDGTESADTWGDGTDSGDLWGPASSYARATVRGLAARGTLFSITFLGGGTTPMAVEQATCRFLGGRRPD